MITLKELKTLNREELKVLKANVELLMSTQTHMHAHSAQTEYELFYDTLCDHIRSRTGEVYPVYSLFARTNTHAKFTAVKEALDEYIERSIHRKVTRTEKQRVYLLYCQLMVGFILGTKMPLNMRTLLNVHNNFPAQLEKNFPDYIQNGMLGWILKAQPHEESIND